MLRSSLESHSVWTLLSQIESHLKSFTKKDGERYSDLQKKTGYLRWVLEKSDPSLLSEQDLTNINNPIQKIVNHIPNNANNLAHFPQIEGYFAQIFAILPYPRVQKFFKTDVNAFVENCAAKTDDAIKEAEAKVEAFSETIDEKLREFSSSRKALLAEISASQSRAEGTNKDLIDLEAKVLAQFGNWETRFDTEIKEKLGELSETFTDSQSKRNKEHESLLNDIAEALRKAQSNTDSTLAANKKQLSDTKQNLKTMSGKITEDAENLLLKINKIYGIAGNNALSGDFSKTAFKEGVAYYVMTILAAIFYIAIPASFAYLWITYIDIGEFSFSNLLSRLPISLVFLAPALYFGNLAQKHRRVSIAFRSLGMRIATFDAYLANFTEVDKNEEKKKMASVFFETGISSERKSDLTYKEFGKALDQMSGPLEKLSKFSAGKSS